VSKSLSRSPRETVRGLRERIRLSSEPGVELLVVWLVATFVVPIVVSWVLFPVFWPRYVLPASLGLYLLVGRGVTRIKRPQLRVAMVLVLLVAVVPVTAYELTTDTREQWDEATAYADEITERGFEHYQTRSDLQVEGVVVPESGTGKAPTTDEEVGALLTGHDEVWLVFSHTNPSTETNFQRLMASNGYVNDEKAEHTFVGITVYSYEREDER
jgi:mannosyltransferase